MDIVQIGSLIISSTALIYTYVNGRRIHKLDLQIKEHEVKKNQIEEEEKKKASIECNVVETSKNEYDILKFYNKGKNSATNISFEFLNDPEDNIQLNMSDDFLPYPKLLPQQSFDVRYLNMGSKPHYSIKIIWDDEFAFKRSIEQVIDI